MGNQLCLVHKLCYWYIALVFSSKYQLHVLQNIFTLFINQLHGLDKPSSASFMRCLQLLEVSKKIILLLCIRDNHYSLESCPSSVFCCTGQHAWCWWPYLKPLQDLLQSSEVRTDFVVSWLLIWFTAVTIHHLKYKAIWWTPWFLWSSMGRMFLQSCWIFSSVILPRHKRYMNNHVYVYAHVCICVCKFLDTYHGWIHEYMNVWMSCCVSMHIIYCIVGKFWKVKYYFTFLKYNLEIHGKSNEARWEYKNNTKHFRNLFLKNYC